MGLRVGTSGWAYRDWQGTFYPPGLHQSAWFAHYAGVFDTVEVNYTFYHLPSQTTVERWRSQAPEGFIYALKGSQQITHRLRLSDVDEPLDRFLTRAGSLGDRLGPILWQLPPRWSADAARLEAFAAKLPRDLVHAFEFRDPSWLTTEIRRILEERGLTFCIFDMPGRTCPKWVTADVIYLRFHGHGQRYAGRYGREALEPWADQIRRWVKRGHLVYAYFNNTARGHAVEDARELHRLCRAVS